jgi:hypothetical protein
MGKVQESHDRGQSALFQSLSVRHGSKDAQLVSQMQWYVYGSGLISKATFEDEFFRKMLKVQNPDAYFISVRELAYYVEAEVKLFLKFLQFATSSLCLRHGGNTYGQGQHDDVTLEDKNKYTSMGFQFVFENVNWILAIAFARCDDGTAVGHADLFTEKFEATTQCKVGEVLHHMVSDVAARKTAEVLDVDDDACEMHQSDKIARAAIGQLTKSRKKVVTNPFDEGQAVMKRMHNLCKEFSWSKRRNALQDICRRESVNIKYITPKLDLNTTRVASQQGMLESVIHLRKAMNVYVDERGSGSDRESKRVAELEVSSQQWKASAEMEAVLNVVRKHSTVVQFEKGMVAGYDVYLTRSTTGALAPEGVLDKKASRGKLPTRQKRDGG